MKDYNIGRHNETKHQFYTSHTGTEVEVEQKVKLLTASSDGDLIKKVPH